MAPIPSNMNEKAKLQLYLSRYTPVNGVLRPTLHQEIGLGIAGLRGQYQYQYQYLEAAEFQYQYQYQYLKVSDGQYQYQYQYLENQDFNTNTNTNSGSWLQVSTNTNTNTGQNSNTSIPILSIDFTKELLIIYTLFIKYGKVSRIQSIFVKLDAHKLQFHTNFV